MSGYSKSPATVGVVIKDGRGLSFEGFNSIKEMVQHYLTNEVLHGEYWASDDHLAALEETQRVLTRIVGEVREEMNNDRKKDEEIKRRRKKKA